MKTEDYLNLDATSFFEAVKREEITMSDAYRYVRHNSNNDTQYLELLLEELNGWILHFDTIVYNQEFEEASAELEKALEKGEEITMPIEYTLSREDFIKDAMAATTYLPEWNEFSREQKEGKIYEFINNHPNRIMQPVIKYYNWETQELNALKRIIEKEIENSTQPKEAAPTIKLNWTGQKNVLTDAFRQMKNKGYLTNSIPDVANFLKSNFDCFENTKQSTIRGMLKNNDTAPNAIPKEEKRINID